MKKTILLLMAAATMLNMTLSAQETYLDKVKIIEPKVSVENRVVTVSMLLDLTEVRMKTQHTVEFTPVLVSANGAEEYEFAPIVVDGGTRHKKFMREDALSKTESRTYADSILKRKNRSEQIVSISKELPYERWMLGSRLELREKTRGCLKCDVEEDTSRIGSGYIPPFIPEYRTKFIEPEVETIKRREEVRSAYINFHQDSYVIIPDFMENENELANIMESIEIAKNNSDLTITGIEVLGYASPEGYEKYNIKLSANRAKALVSYLMENTQMPDSIYRWSSNGEDWSGFIRELKSLSDLPSSEKVIAIAEEAEPGNYDSAEAEIIKLVGEKYYTDSFMQSIYRTLRRNDYKIQYNVKHFDLEEAKALLHERPDLLSLHEMYLVAGSYEKDSQEYKEVLRIAADTYPDNEVALNNYTIELINQGEYESAMDRISSYEGEKSDVINTVAVAYANAGRYEEAVELFEFAAKAGSQEAAHNLEQLENVMTQL